MPRKKSPTYVHEFLLLSTPQDERKMNIRFDFLRKLYNATLSYIFTQNNKMRDDKRHHEACKKYRLAKKKKDEVALAALKKEFDALRVEFGLTKQDAENYSTHCKKSCCFQDHLDSHTVQTIAARAFEAYMDWCIGLRGKPRFKSWKNGLRSISGKQLACVTYKDGYVSWKGLKMPILFSKSDKFGVEAAALQSEVKFCRIVRRMVRGRYKFYVQLVLKGQPKQKANQPIVKGTVGLDIGPSTIAAVSEKGALLEVLCAEVDDLDDEIRGIQRQMARSQFEANPQNYEVVKKKVGERTVTRHKVKKGAKGWKRSNRYMRLLNTLRERQRKLRDKRKYLHDVLANRILALGNQVMTEKLSYRAFQKMFGRSVGRRAPGTFIRVLTRKAEKTGGGLYGLNAWTAKLSQLGHCCGSYRKKSLSQRVHECCGIREQRDLYSAFLALCYDKDEERVDVSRARALYPRIRLILRSAHQHAFHQIATGAPGLRQTAVSNFGKPWGIPESELFAAKLSGG